MTAESGVLIFSLSSLEAKGSMSKPNSPMKAVSFFFIISMFISLAVSDEIEPIPGIGPLSLKKVATSGGFTEGPAILPDGSVVFSDLRTEKVYHLDLAGNLSVFLDQTRRINGLMTGSNGMIYACESRKGQAALVAFDLESKERQALTDAYQGKPYNRVNDLVIDREGGVYFSDIISGEGLPQEKPGVYYVSRDGETTKVIDDLQTPNGVILSRDERFLFVAAMREARVVRYAIQKPGQLGQGETFYKFDPDAAERHGGDGMAIDVNGNFYFAQFAGNKVHVVDPSGALLGVIPFQERTTNCAFGGKDGRTLFVTSGGSLFALRMEVPGHRFPGRLQ